MRETIRRRRRKAAGLALSVVAHLAVLAVLGLTVAPELRLPPSPTPAMEVRFVDLAPSAPGEPQPRQARSSAAAAQSVRAASAAAPASPPRQPSSSPRPAAVPTPLPAAPAPGAAPSGGGAAASGIGVGVHPGPLPGAEAGGDLKGLLRATVGCEHRDAVGLTAAERERCNQRAGEMARNAPEVDRIPPEKRAYYDQVAAAYAKMRAPAPSIQLHNGDNLGIQERWAGEPGAHLPGFGCRAPLGKPRGYKSYHDKPPHSLKLGFLPCFVTPPSGYGTEEADVEDPASRREREDDAKHMRDLDPPPAGK